MTTGAARHCTIMLSRRRHFVRIFREDLLAVHKKKDNAGMRLPGFLARHTEFIANVATLMSGKAVAAMIAIFTLPIVARLFEPAEFGLAARFFGSLM